MSCAPRICRGEAEWASCPSAPVRHPCRTPLCPAGIRAVPDKYCGARRGKREKSALLRNVSYDLETARQCRLLETLVHVVLFVDVLQLLKTYEKNGFALP